MSTYTKEYCKNIASQFKLRIELKKSNPIPFEGIIETYNDHRMAMSFSPLALVYNSIKIANPEVVSKSYPRFWKDLKSVGFSVNLWS